MKRRIYYANQLAVSNFALYDEVEKMIDLAEISISTFGAATLLNGFAATPVPSTLQVNVAGGALFSNQELDATAFGTAPTQLPPDTTDFIQKFAYNLPTNVTTLTFTAPTTPGFSRNDIIQMEFSTADGNPQLLPFWNGVTGNVPNPPVFTNENTQRIDSVNITIKQGIAAATGTQTTPLPDAGAAASWVVTTAQGQTVITSGNITRYENSSDPNALGDYNSYFIIEPLTQKISTVTGDQRYARLEQCAYYQGIINGGMVIAQREDADLTTGLSVYGLVDKMIGELQGTGISSGILSQGFILLPTGSAYSVQAANVTITSSGIVIIAHRMESNNAVNYNNQQASFSCYVLQDTGTTINYQIIASKANVKNNFGALTTLATSSSIPVPTGVPTLIKLENITMGDCTNGIQMEINAACGSVTTKNFNLAQMQLNTGTFAIPFVPQDETFTRHACQRVYSKSYDDGVPVGTISQANEVLSSSVGTGSADVNATIYYPVTMIENPVVTIYNPATGTANEMRGGGGDNVSAMVTSEGTKGFTGQNVGAVFDSSVYGFQWEAKLDL